MPDLTLPAQWGRLKGYREGYKDSKGYRTNLWVNTFQRIQNQDKLVGIKVPKATKYLLSAPKAAESICGYEKGSLWFSGAVDSFA